MLTEIIDGVDTTVKHYMCKVSAEQRRAERRSAEGRSAYIQHFVVNEIMLNEAVLNQTWNGRRSRPFKYLSKVSWKAK